MLDAPKIYLRNPRHPRLKPGPGFLPNEPKRAARRFKVRSPTFKVCRKIRNEPIPTFAPFVRLCSNSGNYQTNPFYHPCPLPSDGRGGRVGRDGKLPNEPIARRAGSTFRVQGSKFREYRSALDCSSYTKITKRSQTLGGREGKRGRCAWEFTKRTHQSWNRRFQNFRFQIVPRGRS